MSQIVKKWMLFSMIVLLSKWNFSQGFRSDKPHAGVQTGLVMNVGTHELSVGIHLKAYIGFDVAQINIGDAFQWKIYSLGKRKMFYENRAYLGTAIMFGKMQSIIDFELDGLSHQSQRNFAIAYNYLIYTDNVGTSQMSGGFGLHIRNVAIRFENDVFAGQARDRFRTGILWMTYKQELYKINLGTYIWTGETRGAFWDNTANSKNMPSGYRSLEDMPYGRTTHGIYYAGIQYLLPFGNYAQFRIGADSELFRHFLQNRLTHDLMLFPKSMPRNTPHYPRLDEEGCPVFEKESVRKTNFFVQVGVND